MAPAMVLLGWFGLTQSAGGGSAGGGGGAAATPAADGRVVPQFLGLGATLLRSSTAHRPQ